MLIIKILAVVVVIFGVFGTFALTSDGKLSVNKENGAKAATWIGDGVSKTVSFVKEHVEIVDNSKTSTK